MYLITIKDLIYITKWQIKKGNKKPRKLFFRGFFNLIRILNRVNFFQNKAILIKRC